MFLQAGKQENLLAFKLLLGKRMPGDRKGNISFGCHGKKMMTVSMSSLWKG